MKAMHEPTNPDMMDDCKIYMELDSKFYHFLY